MSSISIIIPLYNAEKFVNQAYDFICKQTVSLPLEIIFVDNNSKDTSLKMAKELAEIDSRVKVFQEKVQGAAAARNKGFDESSGDFVYFYDVDDQLFDTTLEDLSSVLINDKSIDAYFGKMYKYSLPISDINRSDLDESNEIILKPKPYWGLKWFRDLSSVVGPPAFLYRRETFLNIGKYDNRLRLGQDTALDIQLGMTSKIAFIDKYVYLYLKHGESITDKVKASKSRASMQWPRIIYSHIPFYLQHPEEKEYGKILKHKIYSSVPRIIIETKGFNERKKLKKKLLKDIQPLKFPFVLQLLIGILVFFPSKFLLKIYLYKIMKHYL